jgi:hypothetical protein
MTIDPELRRLADLGHIGAQEAIADLYDPDWDESYVPYVGDDREDFHSDI